ncbi:Alpha integrin [Pseudomonas sp. IT-196MI5]
MRSTERPVRLWSQLIGVVVALDLSMSAHAATSADSPALNRPTCLANGNWYGFYHSNQGLKAVCLKLPEAIGVKMLDSNGDGIVDNSDTLSDGVIFVGEHSTQDAGDNGGAVNDSTGDGTPGMEKTGGSRRIMWRQIQ